MHVGVRGFCEASYACAVSGTGLLMMKDSGAIEEMQRLLCLCMLGGVANILEWICCRILLLPPLFFSTSLSPK